MSEKFRLNGETVAKGYETKRYAPIGEMTRNRPGGPHAVCRRCTRAYWPEEYAGYACSKRTGGAGNKCGATLAWDNGQG